MLRRLGHHSLRRHCRVVKFEEAVQEVFDIQLLPGIRYPDILEPDADLIGASFVLSDEALADVAQPA